MSKSTKKMPAITPRQQRFVDEYLVDLNASAAARRAGYADKRGDVAGQLMRKPQIRAAIAEGRKAQSARLNITADRVLEEIARIALHDPRHLYHPGGQLKDITELDDASAAALAGVDIEDNLAGSFRVHKIKRWDKTKALELLARHLGLFEDRKTVRVEGLDWRALIGAPGEGTGSGGADD